MAERSDYLYAQVRKKMLDAVRMDLIGPTAAEEALTELPTNSYITGMLYPADSDITEDENYNDVEFTEGRLDADGNGSESVVLEDEEPDESTKGGFKKPSSIGVSFYLSEETNKINVDVYWGSYYSDKVDDGEVVDESIEEDYENKKKKKRQVYVREQMAETVELNLDDIGRAKTIPLHSNAHIFIYVIQMRLDNGYKMLSVYLHNNNKGGDEKEYERVMFQVELHVSTKDKEAVFIPEYICRKQELEDEYYYKGRPIFGRGRGCAATWNKREDEENAYSIDSTFIPDHEIPGVREVKVLLGYSRLEMPEPEVDDQKQVVKLKSSGPEKWLPAVEINGEGIFIEFNRATMNEWLTNSRVAERSKKYESCYEEYCKQKGWENFKSRNGEYVLIHTLSHMLIKEMAIQSGYSSSALHERIYSSDKMCGLLIYTGAADKEGSLGGLVELGSMEKLIPLLKGALENGLTCTTDPECFMKNPTTDRINGAACHSCTMISETACENGNRLLDRALVVPLPEHEEMGYFKELVNVLCGIQV